MNANERVIAALVAIAFFAVAIFASFRLDENSQAAAITGLTGVLDAIGGAVVGVLGSLYIERQRTERERRTNYYNHLRDLLDQLESNTRVLISTSGLLLEESRSPNSLRAKKAWDENREAMDEIMRIAVAMPGTATMDLFREVTKCYMDLVQSIPGKPVHPGVENHCLEQQYSAYEWISDYRRAIFAQ
jgi:hypothetical protein